MYIVPANDVLSLVVTKFPFFLLRLTRFKMTSILSTYALVYVGISVLISYNLKHVTLILNLYIMGNQ